MLKIDLETTQNIFQPDANRGFTYEVWYREMGAVMKVEGLRHHLDDFIRVSLMMDGNTSANWFFPKPDTAALELDVPIEGGTLRQQIISTLEQEYEQSLY